MTRKDYIAVAKVFNAAYKQITNEGELEGFTMMVDSMCKTYKEDNPQFDETRFVDACIDS